MTQSQALPRRAVLIVNAQSRKGRALFRESREKLNAAGLTLISAHTIRNPKKLREAIRFALADNPPMIIVGGGDGSLSSSVDDFVGHDTVFALLPLGTANSFARSLGIPLDLDGAINVIANGQRRRIDLSMIDHDYFANCAAIGLSPLIAQTVPHGLKRVLGRVGYLAWAAYKLTQFRPFKLTVGEGDAAVTIDVVEVRIANGSYQGGTELVEKADVDSGEIVVQAVLGDSRHRLLGGQPAETAVAPADHPRFPGQGAARGNRSVPAHLDRRRSAGENPGHGKDRQGCDRGRGAGPNQLNRHPSESWDLTSLCAKAGRSQLSLG